MVEEVSKEPREFRHPYDNRELWDEKLEPVVAFADEFYGQMHALWRMREGQVTPKEVIGHFKGYNSQPHLKAHLGTIEKDLTLYNVWLSATAKADAWFQGGPDAIRDPGFHAELDQVASLIENAMELAGHRPKETTPS